MNSIQCKDEGARTLSYWLDWTSHKCQNMHWWLYHDLDRCHLRWRPKKVHIYYLLVRTSKVICPSFGRRGENNGARRPRVRQYRAFLFHGSPHICFNFILICYCTEPGNRTLAHPCTGAGNITSHWLREYEVKKLHLPACRMHENAMFSPPIHATDGK